MAAFSILSESNNTQSNIKALFEFLSDFKNFASVLPEDKVENFQYSQNECSFDIKGITPMSIKIAEKKPYKYIIYSSEGLAKFNFQLKAQFVGNADEKGQCNIQLDGDLNPFIKAMAEKPLTNLVNAMSLKLSQMQI
ncbi:MAG: SRPBCC family protein [Bacteroidetes bacterium]|nr:SRPBCC family protein [Bacteroidota bacterium]